MNFEYTPKTLDLVEKVDQFMKKHLFPHEKKVYAFSKSNLWENYPEMENWKKLAQAKGLW
ncbi:MAG: acyl-CoA dehydrogenase, partial [Candidatus Arcticimaribacter sp.]